MKREIPEVIVATLLILTLFGCDQNRADGGSNTLENDSAGEDIQDVISNTVANEHDEYIPPTLPSEDPDEVARGAIHAITTGDGSGIHAFYKPHEIELSANTIEQSYGAMLAIGRDYFYKNSFTLSNGNKDDYEKIKAVFEAFGADENWKLPESTDKLAFVTAMSKASVYWGNTGQELIGAEVIEIKQHSANRDFTNYQVTLKVDGKENVYLLQIQRWGLTLRDSSGKYWFFHQLINGTTPIVW